MPIQNETVWVIFKHCVKVSRRPLPLLMDVSLKGLIDTMEKCLQQQTNAIVVGVIGGKLFVLFKTNAKILWLNDVHFLPIKNYIVHTVSKLYFLSKISKPI